MSTEGLVQPRTQGKACEGKSLPGYEVGACYGVELLCEFN